MIKKILLFLTVAIAALAAGCSQSREWTREQRREMKENLRQYRNMVYLENMNDSEFGLFTDDVAASLEVMYPVYATFIAVPNVNDTITAVVVTTIVSDINADARNMRYLFPYENLVADSILPAGMSHKQLRAYYKCVADQINANYNSLASFLNAYESNRIDTTVMGQSLRYCAGSDVLITVEETEIITD